MYFFIDFSFIIFYIIIYLLTHNIHTVNKFHLFQFESFNSVAELEF